MKAKKVKDKVINIAKAVADPQEVIKNPGKYTIGDAQKIDKIIGAKNAATNTAKKAVGKAAVASTVAKETAKGAAKAGKAAAKTAAKKASSTVAKVAKAAGKAGKAGAVAAGVVGAVALGKAISDKKKQKEAEDELTRQQRLEEIRLRKGQ